MGFKTRSDLVLFSAHEIEVFPGKLKRPTNFCRLNDFAAQIFLVGQAFFISISSVVDYYCVVSNFATPDWFKFRFCRRLEILFVIKHFGLYFIGLVKLFGICITAKKMIIYSLGLNYSLELIRSVEV